MAVAKLGVVYTPRAVAARIVERTLAPLVAGKTGDAILAVRVCDFAIGEGAFLVELVRYLAAAHGGRDAKRLVAAHCVFGADIDPAAVATARAAVEAFAGGPVPLDHLRTGDALALAWDRFDAVVGNPPYIRQEKLARATKQALRGYASYDGVADLYVYFLELAHRLVRDGGRYGVIVPSKWLTAAYARPLRAWLAREGSVEAIDEVPRAFPEHDAFPCIVIGERGAGIARPGRAGDPWHLDERADAQIFARWSALPVLGATLAPSRGVVTGCNRAFVISGAARARILDDDPDCEPLIRPFVKGRDLRRWRAEPGDRYLLMCDRGVALPAAIRRHLAPLRAQLEPGTGRKPGTYKWYELQDPIGALAKSAAPRLFYQDIQTAPACALDTTGLVPDTTVWILGTDDRFVLAVLNSKLYAWYARRRFPPALNGAVRPKREFIAQLPLPQPPPALRARITELVELQLVAPTAARDRELDARICAAYDVSGNLIV
ncbi:MAG TPA: Eco57I restriction-modification methylase domain-containing protein [Kofleriaceae bacterium]|nr:Eco57I restriction-modification methylase domain-containing protein [Kofleriaceae bacterium]